MKQPMHATLYASVRQAVSTGARLPSAVVPARFAVVPARFAVVPAPFAVVRTLFAVIPTLFAVVPALFGPAPVLLAASPIVAVIGPAAANVQSAEVLAGKWQRDDARGDRSYWMREYPEMTLEIDVAADRIDVRQALGQTRDGVALPGSGNEFLEYTLILDGEEREVPSAAGSRRATARWENGAMTVDIAITMGGDGPDAMEVPMQQRWTVIDGGETLVLERTFSLPDRGPRTSTLFFGRIDSM